MGILLYDSTSNYNLILKQRIVIIHITACNTDIIYFSHYIFYTKGAKYPEPQ